MHYPNSNHNLQSPSNTTNIYDETMALDAKASVDLTPLDQAGDVPKIVRFPRYTLAEMLAMPPKEWIVGNVIGAGDVGMIFGPSGEGKTFTVIDMAFAAATGKPWAGRFEVARPLTVAYAAGEGQTGLAQRLQSAALSRGLDNAPMHIYLNAPQLYNANDPCNALAFVEEYEAAVATGEVEPLDLLFLDTLHSVTAGADENSSQHIGMVLRQAKGIAARLGCAVFLVHHTGKSGDAERGSSSLRGAMDVMIRVCKVGDSHLMTCEKLKDGAPWQPQTFDLVAKIDSAYVLWGEVGDIAKANGQQAQDKERLLEVMSKNPSTRFGVGSLAEAIGKGTNHTRNLLSQMERNGECLRELADSGKPSSSRNPWVYSHKNLT